MDVLLTALRRADEQRTMKVFYRAECPDVYRTEESSYADDLESISDSSQLLQDKADIVSAFCVITGLQLSHGKLRRVVQNVIPSNLLQDMIVYRHPWQPCKVTINTTDPTEYLGGIYDVHSSGTSTLDMVLESADIR